MIPANETFDGTFPFEPHFTTAPDSACITLTKGPGRPSSACTANRRGATSIESSFRRWPATFGSSLPITWASVRARRRPIGNTRCARTWKTCRPSLPFGLTEITLVLQDWGGPIGAAYTLRNPGRVRRLILMNTILGYSAAVTDVADPARKPPRLTSSNWFR